MPPRVLYPNNPRAAHNMTQFSYKERAYKRDDQVSFMFSISCSMYLFVSGERDRIYGKNFSL